MDHIKPKLYYSFAEHIKCQPCYPLCKTPHPHCMQHLETANQYSLHSSGQKVGTSSKTTQLGFPKNLNLELSNAKMENN